jgi:hypothetical protein
MMPAVVVAILALAGLAYVAAALASPAEGVPPPADGRRADLDRRAHAALVAIIDLEDERDTGKLTMKDFEALVGAYEQDALAALEALDELDGAGPDDPLEREIAAVKARLRAASQSPTSPEPGPR